MTYEDGDFIMRLAILSDIHGNLEALQKAVQIVEDLRCDEMVCLGDMVGYGPNPNECVDLIRRTCRNVVLGNHDYAVLNPGHTERFNDIAKTSVEWTQHILDGDHRDYLAGLPLSIELDDMLLVHASPDEPKSWKYIFDCDDAVRSLAVLSQTVCFVGHTHVPCFFSTDPMMSDFHLSKTYKHIINVGSVGQPRDGDYRLSFGLFDTAALTYQQVRADYDVQSTVNKIRQAELPSFLADRLLRGR